MNWMLLSFYYVLIILNVFLFICFFRKPSTAIIFSTLIFSYGWRFVSVSYIGMEAVPVDSEQLRRTIQGIRPAISYFAINAIYMGAVLFFWRKLEERFLGKEVELTPSAGKVLRAFDKVFFFAMLGMIFFALVELFVKDIIPVRDCIERGAFNAFYTGFFHSFIIEHASMYSFFMGTMTFSPLIINTARPKQKYIFLVFFFILYGFLTSNRFSFFLKLFLSFVSPLAFYLIQSRKDSYLKLIREFQILKPLGGYTLIIVFAMLLGLGNSYFRVRGNCEVNNKNFSKKIKEIENQDTELLEKSLKLNNVKQVENKVFERLFVQQGEMWWPVHQRLGNKSLSEVKEAIHFLFFEPFIKGRNTGIQYVMMKTLGYEQAYSIVVEHGQTYAINQYDIFIESFGIYMGLLFIVASAGVFTLFTYVLIRAYRKGRIFTLVTGVYAFYGVHLLTYAGMINFFQSWTYWLKFSVFIFFTLYENKILELPFIVRMLNFLTRTKSTKAHLI